MPFVGSIEGKMDFGYSPTSKIVTTNMLLYLDAGNPSSYPGTGTIWTDLSPNANNATNLTNATYSSSNGGYLTFNSGYGQLTPSKYNTPYTGKTIFVAGKLTSIAIGTFRAMLGTSDTVTNRNFNFYMYSPSLNTYQLHFSAGLYGSFSTNLSYTPGNWFTAAITQTTGGTLIYYLNGQQVNQTSMTFSQYIASSNEYVAQADNNWYGPLSVICVYSTALTPAQIQANHNAVRGRYGL
jgi:Concanavalin A-like lectin/glucanases superfamily